MGLFEEIQSDIKKYNLEQKMIAKNIGVSAPSLSFYLSEENQMSFVQFFLLVKEVYSIRNPSAIKSKLKEFLITPTKKNSKTNSNIIECLEWALQHGEEELFAFAQKLERKVSGNDLADLYQLAMERLKKKIKPKDLLMELDSIKSKLKGESLALFSILRLFCFYESNNYQGILLYIDTARIAIGKLKKGYIKESYLLTLSQLNITALMKNKFVEEAIRITEYNLKTVDQRKFPHGYNFLYSFMAELYVFTDLSRSLEYIEKAISESPLDNYSTRKLGLMATRDFIKIHSGDFEGVVLKDTAEKAHYYAKQGKKEKALEILDEINLKNGKLTAFQYYYKALATKNKTDMDIAREKFYISGDFYYSELTKNIEI